MQTAGLGTVLIKSVSQKLFVAKDLIPHLWYEFIKFSLRTVYSQMKSSLQLLRIVLFVVLLGFLFVFIFKGSCQLTVLICLYVMFILGKQIRENFTSVPPNLFEIQSQSGVWRRERLPWFLFVVVPTLLLPTILLFQQQLYVSSYGVIKLIIFINISS